MAEGRGGAVEELLRLARSRGGWQLLAGQVGPKAASTLTVLVSSALLGPDGRGEIAFVTATASLLSAAAVFGLFVPAGRGEGPIPRQFLDLLVLLAVVVDAVLIVVAAVAPSGLLTLASALLIAINAMLLALVVFAQHVLQLRVSDREYFLLGAVWPLAGNVVLVVGLLLGMDVRGYLWGWTALNAGMAAWAVVRLIRLLGVRVARPYAVGNTLRAVAPFGFAFIAASLATRGDITVLGIRSTADQVGQYSLATAVSGLLFMVSQVFTLRAAASHRAVEPDAYAAQVRRLTRSAVVTVAAVSVPLLVIGWALVTVALPTFRPSLLPMAILCLAALPETYSRIHSWALGMIGDHQRLLAYAGVSLVVFASYFWAARWGAVGVAVASVIGYSAQALVVTVKVRWSSPDVSEPEGDATLPDEPKGQS